MTADKLTLPEARVRVGCARAAGRLGAILRRVGCARDVADAVAAHLVEASRMGVESHGVVRVIQYVEQFRRGAEHADGMRAEARPAIVERDGLTEVDGDGGIGIVAMQLALEHSLRRVERDGIVAVAVRNAGHTGRLGAFTEAAADASCMMILIGGGNRAQWRQVAPHGGRAAMLPTNPWSIAIPGGARGPVVLDFATGAIAGGWIYAARSAGALLPDGALIDRHGRPSRDPQAYFDGGAILPKGGALGYGLGLIAELIGEAMLGPVAGEANSLMITMDALRYNEQHRFRAVAETLLAELRATPTADGFARVEIPGERERERATDDRIAVPARTWAQILALPN
ncbi:MAG: Ldh family oxidoreductase [bacterium]